MLKRASGGISAPFSLAFLTDRQRIRNPEPIMRALPAGAAVIYRDYDDPRRAGVARRYAAICKKRGVLFLVAGDETLARFVGADGVHWPAWAPFPAPPLAGEPSRLAQPRGSTLSARRGHNGSSFLFTAACHDAGKISLAHAHGADMALLSPAFATASHPGTEHWGPARFRELAAASPLPVLALGGVDAGNAALLAGRNVAGLAAIGAFFADV